MTGTLRIAAALCLGVLLMNGYAAEPSTDGLLLRLDASADAFEEHPDGTIARWGDTSGNGNDVRSRGPANAPRRVPNAWNGLPVVRFDGEDDFLDLPSLRTARGPATVFIVFRRTADQTDGKLWQRVFSAWDGVAGDDTKPPCFHLGTGQDTGPLDGMVRHLEESDVPLDRLCLGANAVHRGQNFRGDVAEILVYDRGFLSEDAIGMVMRYLARKWDAVPARRPSGWTRTGPLGETPAHERQDLPLSDQANRGHWVRFEPMWDEFDGETLAPDKWWPRNPEWKGRQPAWFHPGNVTVSDGKLHLAMRKEEVPEMEKANGYHTYTSAAVKSRETVLYGYFEVKAIAMKSAGSSAFWFYRGSPEEWTEIDVFEIGGGAPGFERKYNMNLHVFHTPEEKKHWSTGGVWEAPWDLAADYHVYGLEWARERVRYFVDGVLVRDVPNSHWHQDLHLNFDSETMPNWFGLPEDGDLPSTFSIEYVRAWKAGTETP